MNSSFSSICTKSIVTGFLCLVAQYCILRYVTPFVLALILTVLVLLIACHYLLESTLRYRTVFLFSLLLLLISGCFTYLCQLQKVLFQISYEPTLLLLCALIWSVPATYCFIRQLNDFGPQFPDYYRYFISMSVLKLIPVTAAFIVLTFIYPDILRVYTPTKPSYIPFYTIATYIEAILYDETSLIDLAKHIAINIGLYVPFGLYVKLMIRHLNIWLQMVCFIAIPSGIELIKLLLKDSFDMDNIIYGTLGLLLGSLFYYLINHINYAVKEEEFLTYSPIMRLSYRR